jgi:hypothetical protein
VTVSIEAAGPGLVIPTGAEKEIDVIVVGAIKEIFSPIKAGKPMETIVKGPLRYSDRVESDKGLAFSFPVRVRQTRMEFKKIKNPYIIG